MKKIIIPIVLALVLITTLFVFAEPKLKSNDQVYECSDYGDDGFCSPEEVKVTVLNFSDYILNVIKEYERDGSYPYSWVNGYKGVSRDLYYDGTKIANANPDSSHSTYCCGLTFEVYFRSIMQFNKDKGYPENINNMSVADFNRFISLWFVQETKGDGPGEALEAYGLGTKISNMKDVQKGDFVQIWRTSGSGHSVIFINWIVNEEGDTTGMKYWSTQPGTNGANYNTEYFSGFGGKVDKAHTHYSRARNPKDFTRF